MDHQQKITHVKLGSTPQPLAWSQAYNAGSLFAIVSLSRKEEVAEQPLSVLGKDIVNALEEEYFTLEEKSYDSIKLALSSLEEKIPLHVTPSIVVVAILKNVLYGFIIGSGVIELKRKAELTPILSVEHSKLQSVSGYLQDDDKIILSSPSFSQLLSKEELAKHLATDPLSDIAEDILPLLHKTEDGSLCALALSFKQDESAGESTFETETISEPVIHEGAQRIRNNGHEETLEEAIEQQPDATHTPFRGFNLPTFHIPLKITQFFSLSHKKKLFLSVCVLLLLILSASIYFAKKQQEDTKRKALFDATYAQALQKYEDGQSLADLNTPLSRDNLTEAEKILKDAQNSFPKGTDERTKTDELLGKVQTSLADVSGASQVSAEEAALSNSPLLLALSKNKNASSAVSNGNTVFLLGKNNISSFNSTSEQTKEVIKNDNAWQNGVGIGRYLSNLYVLDTKDGIVKFVPSGSSYSKSSYLTTNVDLSNAKDIALDTSVWVLFSDGTIQKFLRGKPESFSVTGLDTAFKNPSKIYTDTDSKNLYILDKGNGRIVVLDKNGAYTSQYQAGILKNAVAFDIQEKDKIIYVLANNKAYKFPMK